MSLAEKLLIGEALTLVALTVGLLVWRCALRVALVAGHLVPIKAIASSRDGWPA